MGRPEIRKASAAAIAANSKDRAPSDNVGTPETLTELNATPVGAVPTAIGLPTTVFVAASMTETVFEL